MRSKRKKSRPQKIRRHKENKNPNRDDEGKRGAVSSESVRQMFVKLFMNTLKPDKKIG